MQSALLVYLHGCHGVWSESQVFVYAIIVRFIGRKPSAGTSEILESQVFHIAILAVAHIEMEDAYQFRYTYFPFSFKRYW